MNDGLRKMFPPTGWQPIETAPKDGTKILVWDQEYKEWEKVTWKENWEGSDFRYQFKWCVWLSGEDEVHTVVENPTHWMPLPGDPNE